MKEFGYPIPYDDFWELCDVNPESCFHKPFDLGHGETGIANGRMVLRTLQAVHESDKVTCEEAVERIENLNWDFFNYPERDDLRAGMVIEWERNWKTLKDRSGAMARPQMAAWAPTIDPERRGEFDFVDRPRILVGSARVVVPVTTLQLLRRLPNCEIFVGDHGNRRSHGREHHWLYFRFTNGKGIASSVLMENGMPADGEAPIYGIWAPRVDQGLASMEIGI
jgi:hypothetical protein